MKESLDRMNACLADELDIWVLGGLANSLWIKLYDISLSSIVGGPSSLTSFLDHRIQITSMFGYRAASVQLTTSILLHFGDDHHALY